MPRTLMFNVQHSMFGVKNLSPFTFILSPLKLPYTVKYPEALYVFLVTGV